MFYSCFLKLLSDIFLQTKAVGWKATDWNLENPDWKGKMRLVSMGPGAKMLLEEKEEEVISSTNVTIDFPTSPSNNFSYCQLRNFQVALVKIEFRMFSSSHPKSIYPSFAKAMKGESRLFFFPHNPCGQQQRN